MHRPSTFRSAIYNFHCWKLKYFSLALGCDMPVLEAIFFHPSRFTLYQITDAFMLCCLHAQWKDAIPLLWLLRYYDELDWGWLANTMYNLSNEKYPCIRIRFPFAVEVWQQTETLAISEYEKIERWLNVCAQLDQTQPGFFNPSSLEIAHIHEGAMISSQL